MDEKSLKKSRVKMLHQVFPAFSGKSLSGVSVSTPEALFGKTHLISIGFRMVDQPLISEVTSSIIQQFNKFADFDYFEFPVVSRKQAPFGWLREVIDNQMKASIPVVQHKKIVTIYEDYHQVLNLLGKRGYDGPYFFVTDFNARIVLFEKPSANLLPAIHYSLSLQINHRNLI